MAHPQKQEQQQHVEYPEAEYDSGIGGSVGAAVYRDTNAVPRTPAGTTLHMDLIEGDLSSRILTVGDPTRAARIAAALDDGADGVRLHKVSARGFVTYTGRFEGVDVSIVAIGMGLAMADFFVRETRQIVAGPMLVARYGTCGILVPGIAAGGVLVATEGSVLVQRNPDAFLSSDDANEASASASGNGGGGPHHHKRRVEPYLIFRPQPADGALSEALVRELRAELGDGRVVGGLNASADSFYSSQGRRDEHFEDDNGELLDRLRREYPSVASMEMETFQLLALAGASKNRCIRAGAASIGLANRPTGEVCSEAVLDDLEVRGGRAVLQALVRTEL